MKIVEKKYPYFFFAGDFKDLKEATDDVFYEVRGRRYSQFHKGQLIPSKIWDEIFTEEKQVETKKVVEPPVEKELEKVVEKPKVVKSEAKEEVVKKPRKKRSKSIIKK